MIRYAVLTIVLLFSATAHAQDDVDIFTVSRIVVDAEGQNATDARQNAIAAGASDGLRKLFERLTLQEDHDTLPPVPPGFATSIATGFQIDNELRSPTRYRGLLTVSFDPDRVSKYLRDYDVSFVESASPPTLVLPVLIAAGRARLWDGNPWADSWDETRYENSFTPVYLPEGYESDRDLLDARGAMEPDLTAIRHLAREYGAEKALVAVARPESGDVVVELTLIRTEPSYEDFAEMESRPDIEPEMDPFGSSEDSMDDGAGPEEADPFPPFTDGFTPEVKSLGAVRARRGEADNILELAADRAQLRLAEEWKQKTVVQANVRTDIALTVLYRDIREWLALQQVIGRSPFVADARLDAMSADGALMTVSYRGLREQLAGDLFRRGVRLQADPGLGEVAHAAAWTPLSGEGPEEPADAPSEERFGRNP